MSYISQTAMMRARISLFGSFVFLSSPAFAEVADKEPTALQLWLVPAAITAIAFVFAMKRPLLALCLLPVSMVCAWAGIDELLDPQVGPAIRAELGAAYVIQGYLAAAMAIAGPIAAWTALRFSRARTKR